MSEQGRAWEPMRHVPRAERFAMVLAALVLLGVAFLFVLLTIDLIAAASGSSYSVWDEVGFSRSSGDLIALLFSGVVVGVLLTIAGMRLRDPVLRVTVSDGIVVLRAAAVEASLIGSMSGDPDVLRTSVQVRVSGSEVKTDVVVLLRPLADEQRVRTEAGMRMHAALCESMGMLCPPLHMEVQSVPVDRLARYL